MKIMSDAVFDALISRIHVLEASTTDLTAKIVDMKRDGFDRPRTQSVAHATETVDDRIMAAIRCRAGEGSSLERELMQYADALLLADTEIEDVADMILSGTTIGDD